MVTGALLLLRKCRRVKWIITELPSYLDLLQCTFSRVDYDHIAMKVTMKYITHKQIHMLVTVRVLIVAIHILSYVWCAKQTYHHCQGW